MTTGLRDSADVDVLDNSVLRLTESLRTVKKSLEPFISRKSSSFKLMLRTIYVRSDLKEQLEKLRHILEKFNIYLSFLYVLTSS